MNYTTSILAALTSEYTGGIPNAKFYAASTKNNLVSGIHTSGNVENNPITAFNITVKKRGNNDYWRSYNYYDNKTAVCFTPPSRGYYDITVTRITNFDNDSSFYLAISRHN